MTFQAFDIALDLMSFTFRFNYLPADLANTTIQLREPREVKGDGEEPDEVTAS